MRPVLSNTDSSEIARREPIVRALASAGAVVAVAAMVGLVAPIALASPMRASKPAAIIARVLAHPDAALVASTRAVNWTAVTLVVCLLLARQVRLSIFRPIGRVIRIAPRNDCNIATRRSSLRASRNGGLYGP